MAISFLAGSKIFRCRPCRLSRCYSALSWTFLLPLITVAVVASKKTAPPRPIPQVRTLRASVSSERRHRSTAWSPPIRSEVSRSLFLPSQTPGAITAHPICSRANNWMSARTDVSGCISQVFAVRRFESSRGSKSQFKSRNGLSLGELACDAIGFNAGTESLRARCSRNRKSRERL
jgi:hypothetical protein